MSVPFTPGCPTNPLVEDLLVFSGRGAPRIVGCILRKLGVEITFGDVDSTDALTTPKPGGLHPVVLAACLHAAMLHATTHVDFETGPDARISTCHVETMNLLLCAGTTESLCHLLLYAVVEGCAATPAGGRPDAVNAVYLRIANLVTKKGGYLPPGVRERLAGIVGALDSEVAYDMWADLKEPPEDYSMWRESSGPAPARLTMSLLSCATILKEGPAPARVETMFKVLNTLRVMNTPQASVCMPENVRVRILLGL